MGGFTIADSVTEMYVFLPEKNLLGIHVNINEAYLNENISHKRSHESGKYAIL